MSRAWLAVWLTSHPIVLPTSSLNKNSIGEAGARAMAEALKHNSNITALTWWVLPISPTTFEVTAPFNF